MKRPLLLVTPGDPAGVGPELLWKTIKAGRIPTGTNLLCIGARSPFEKMGVPIVLANDTLAPPKDFPGKKPFLWLLPAPDRAPKGRFLPGFQAGWSIETAARLLLAGRADALVTGPIHKERLQRGGYLFPGHTEFLASLCGTREVTMMLANSRLRISLVTTHLPLKAVAPAITPAALRRAVKHTALHLSRDFAIPCPRIGVAALNPHAGEEGLFGTEEIRILAPTVRALQKEAGGRFQLVGPLPADTLFAKHKFDAVVCMYHDQGLIPVKLIDFARTVNITLGLPIIRTSVDHGVAFDLVGTGRADPSSLQAALALAARLSRQRRRTARAGS